ncbi:hypothetical protein [Paenibacillus sp. L3-i20]|uniref:hypothetical protein n=1 Tax=Paenibacillus sp. L3-i20 TaxID=2905833 RepID=UPI001EDD533B|nr:hypothetical protein [Paenibacillus sp. L3-i20]GKU79868.1 hypothetical protein L3i20_v242650 [Paenibacillus sp. L3-i20]
MPVKQYQRKVICSALQFTNTEPAHVQEIINFVAWPISIDYTAPQDVKLRVIRSSYDVLVAGISDFIVKKQDGSLSIAKSTDFLAEYTELII